MTSSRLPPLHRKDLDSPEQKAAFDTLEKEASTIFGPPGQSPFVYKDDSGAFVGPLPILLAAPEAGTHLLGTFRKLAAIPGLPADAKETVILTVGAHFQAPYELYSHKNVAVKKAGMPTDVVEALAKGDKPEGLNDQCGLAHDAAKHLVTKPGKLSDELWGRCVDTFGKEGTVALVHYA